MVFLWLTCLFNETAAKKAMSFELFFVGTSARNVPAAWKGQQATWSALHTTDAAAESRSRIEPSDKHAIY